MKPQVIKCSFSRELFSSNGNKNFLFDLLKIPPFKDWYSCKAKKRPMFFVSRPLFCITNFIIYII